MRRGGPSPPRRPRDDRRYLASLMTFPTTSGYARNQSVRFTHLPPLPCHTCPSPPPSWSVGVASRGGTRPPRVKSLIFSKPALASAPVILPSGLALSALVMASTWIAARHTPRLVATA